jgi:phosphoketolase
MSQEMIILKIREYGEYEVQVPRDDYEAAKADDELDQYLDHEMSNVPTDTVIIEPDGTVINPY